VQSDVSRIDRIVARIATPNVSILGCDIAGRVEAVGGAVEAFKPGDDVYGDLCASGFGAFAEYACVPVTTVAPKPAGMSYEQAAAIPQAGMLAVQGLIDVGGIHSGQRLLLNGAGGGVGTFALQIARLFDVEITAVDKAGKLEMLRALGADRVVDFNEEDFTRGEPRYDLVLDVKTNRSPFAYARALNRGGRYVTVGGSVPRLLQIVAAKPIISRVQHKHIGLVILKPNKDLSYLNKLFTAGKLRPVIEGPFKLSELREAFRLFGRSDHQGKIVVSMT
jgi:NADPH:quinone reductase-like Zn-dependent oxidoreductase